VYLPWREDTPYYVGPWLIAEGTSTYKLSNVRYTRENQLTKELLNENQLASLRHRHLAPLDIRHSTG